MEYIYKTNLDQMTIRPPKSKVDGDDDDDDFNKMFPILPKNKPYNIWEHTYSAQQIHIYFNQEIKGPEQYSEIIHRINVAAPADVIFIHLNTPGGRLDTGVQLINAMQSSQAKIVTILEATAYSLGTLIFLSGDEMIVHDNCMMMIHNFRGGVVGKGHEQLAELHSTVKWFTSIAKKVYTPFLSKDELDRVIKGEDIWMTSADIRKRLDRIKRDNTNNAKVLPKPETEFVDGEEQVPAPKPRKRAKKSPSL